jgi:hypothetical protein
MAYTLPFVKVNIEGHFGSSTSNVVEKWMTGFHVIKNGGMSATPGELTAFFTNIIPIISTFHTSATLTASTTAWLDSVSGALIGTDGHYANGSLQPTTRVALGTPVSGVGAATQPYSTALVFSLRGLNLRGPASHGRMYWPFLCTSIAAATGVIAPATTGSIATLAQTMINGITAQCLSSFGAGTYVGLVSPIGAGFQSPVTQVWVGGRVDHMESREGSLLESYVARSLSVTSALLAERDREIRDLLDEQREELEDA